MGMSASQARYLQLTARKSNVEFEIQQTTQAKLMLAQQMDDEALQWSNGMNIQHLYYAPNGSSTASSDLPRLTYQLVTGSVSDGDGLGMQVIDEYGRKVVSALPSPFPENEDIRNYVVDKNCLQADYFENNLKTGNWTLQKGDPLSEDGWTNVVIDGEPYIYQGVDANDLTLATTDYEEKTRKLQNKDKQFDMRIQSLSREQKAIENELESVKKVIDKNIDETFKTFA